MTPIPLCPVVCALDASSSHLSLLMSDVNTAAQVSICCEHHAYAVRRQCHACSHDLWSSVHLMCRDWTRRLIQGLPNALNQENPPCPPSLGLMSRRAHHPLLWSPDQEAQHHPCSPHSHPHSPLPCQSAPCQPCRPSHMRLLTTFRLSWRAMRRLQSAPCPSQPEGRIPNPMQMTRQP